jgi:hypothetical protein
MSLPIRQGKLFPNSPPPSKKFGRSLGTIKVNYFHVQGSRAMLTSHQYRFDLAPVYLSHMYQQISQNLWAAGKSQSLGIKARFGRFQADAHQRAQEKTVKHPILDRTTVVVHKPFYAADLILDDVRVVGIRADFVETRPNVSPTTPMPGSTIHDGSPATVHPHASALPKNRKAWFSNFDYIDADRKPLDKDPVVEIVDIGECPMINFSKRVKARQVSSGDGESTLDGDNDSGDGRVDIESSKFGHEKSHICLLGAGEGVGPAQIRITKARIAELESRLDVIDEHITSKDKSSDTARLCGWQGERDIIIGRLKSLHQCADELASKERRHIDDDTLEQSGTKGACDDGGHDELAFENTFHVHCPKIFYNNASRNVS